MTTANKVTMLRIAMIPMFMAVSYTDMRYSELFALIVFAVASITDSVDGYIARKYNQISDFGKFMDPVADKLLVFAALLIFVERGQMPSWAAMTILVREFAVTSLRLVAVEGGVVLAAGTSGKIKTVVSIIGICFMLTPIHGFELLPGLLTVDSFAVWLMVITTLWSGIEYFYTNRKLLNMSK